MSASQLKKAVLLSQVVHLTPGEQLIKKDEPGNSMYIIVEGRLDVLADRKVMARLEPGDVVGEMAYFSKEKRTADVVASDDATLVVFNDKAQRHSMRWQKKIYIKIMRNVISIIVGRLEKN